MSVSADALSRIGRISFIVAIASGVTLIAIPLARSGIEAGRAGDRLVVLAKPLFSDEGLKTLRSDVELVSAAGQEVNGAARQRYEPPARSADLARLPAATALGEHIVSNLEQHQSDFNAAASLPGAGLTLEQGAWAVLALGATLVVVGLLGLYRPRRALVVAVALSGVVMIAAPLATNYPAKTADTDAVLDSLRPYSVEKVQTRVDALATLHRVFSGDELAPSRRQQVNDALDRIAPLVDFSQKSRPLLVQATRLPTRALTWLIILPAAVLLLSAALVLVKDRLRLG